MTTLNRRTFLTLAGAGLGSAGLAACAGTGGRPSGGNGGGGEVDTITWWSNHPANSKEVEEHLIGLFTEETGINVRLVDGGASYEELAQRFNAALAGGDLPDVIVASDVNWFNFAMTDAITPVNEIWDAAEVDQDSIVDSLREDYHFDGSYYAMPFARSTPLFYFNREMMAQAGLEERGPETWAEFAEWAPDILSATGVAPLTIPDGTDYLDWYFQGMIWTFGGAYSDEWDPQFTRAESLEAGRFLQEQADLGHILVSNDANNQFGAGQAACLLQSTGSLSGLTADAQFEFGTAFLPGPAPGCSTGGAGLAVPQRISDERKEAAVRFIDYITSVENTIYYSQNVGYMPVRKEAVTHPDTESYLEDNPNARTALEQLEFTQSQDYARAFVPGGGQRIGGALDRIVAGQDVETVFTELSDETRTVYERDIEPEL